MAINKNNPNKSLFYLKYFHSIVFLCVTVKSYPHFYWSVCFFPASFRHSPSSETHYFFSYWVSPKSTSKLAVSGKSSLSHICHVQYVLKTPQGTEACAATKSAQPKAQTTGHHLLLLPGGLWTWPMLTPSLMNWPRVPSPLAPATDYWGVAWSELILAHPWTQLSLLEAGWGLGAARLAGQAGLVKPWCDGGRPSPPGPPCLQNEALM